MQRRGPKAGIDTDPERAEVMSALAPPTIQGYPPNQSPYRSGKSTQEQRMAKRADAFNRLFLETAEMGVQFRQRQQFRRPYMAEQDGRLLAELTLHGNRSDVR